VSNQTVKKTRLHDSSKTRVQPVFSALDALRTNWLPKLLDLAAGTTAASRPWRNQDMTIVRADWTGKEKGSKERALFPPVTLLRELASHIEFGVGPSLDGPGENRRLRRLLRDKDAGTLMRAEQLLGQHPRRRFPWCTFEGPTYPDVVVETPDAVVVIEGKRREAGPTTKTQWMPIRHQMLRHIDAAWEIRKGRSVYGLFIVSAKPEKTGTVPSTRWQKAVEITRNLDAVKKSLPHRSPDERADIANSLIGITTWESVCKEFGLSLEILLEDNLAEPMQAAQGL
jgi:hypothetical protein